MSAITYYCPACGSEELGRAFAWTGRLVGWHDYCLRCDWHGVAAHYTDRHKLAERESNREDRPPFSEWPDGQGE